MIGRPEAVAGEVEILRHDAVWLCCVLRSFGRLHRIEKPPMRLT